MGAISPIHIAIVLIIALVVFGPKRIPELGKSIGSALHEFQKGAKDLQESMGIDGLNLNLDPTAPKEIEAASAPQAQTAADTTVSAASTTAATAASPPAAAVQAPPAD
jgi:sec-independent protein translocase protein TatA